MSGIFGPAWLRSSFDMSKRKRKLSAGQRAEKRRRKQEYMTIFVRGKQKRVRRPPTIDGMDIEEFILRNADPTWLHQNELWEYMGAYRDREASNKSMGRAAHPPDSEDPF